MTILSTDKNNFKQFLSGNYISNKSLDSCIHAKPSNKYCLIHATQSGGPYQTLLCRFEGLGREAVEAEQPGFVIGGTGTETIYQQTKWQPWLFSIWLSFDIVRFA